MWVCLLVWNWVFEEIPRAYFHKRYLPGVFSSISDLFTISLHSISCSLENLNSQLSVKKLRGPSVKSFVSKANTKLYQNRLEVSQNIHYYYMLQGGIFRLSSDSKIFSTLVKLNVQLPLMIWKKSANSTNRTNFFMFESLNVNFCKQQQQQL